MNMAEIEELDETAQRLRIMWRKTNNYYASFASILFDTKKQFEEGRYPPDWTFSKWLLLKAGFFEEFIMKQLQVHSRVIHAEARELVERENIRIAVEKRKAKQAALAERRAAAAERKVIAAHKKREQEQARAERQQLRLGKPAPPAPSKKPRGAEAKERDRQRMATARANAKAQAEAGPENTVLRDGLAECRKIEATSRVELGRIYLRLKEEVDMHRAGKNPGCGKFWTWGEWSSFYIKDRGLRSVQQCIAEYNSSLLNAQGVRVQQSENVVQFTRTVGEVA